MLSSVMEKCVTMILARCVVRSLPECLSSEADRPPLDTNTRSELLFI